MSFTDPVLAAQMLTFSGKQQMSGRAPQVVMVQDESSTRERRRQELQRRMGELQQYLSIAARDGDHAGIMKIQSEIASVQDEISELDRQDRESPVAVSRW